MMLMLPLDYARAFDVFADIIYCHASLMPL